MTKLKQLFSIAVLQKLILFYMLAQPIVDIATSFLVRGGFDVTIGVVFRALFLALMGVYGLFFYRGPKRKLVVLYLAAVVAFAAVQMAYLFLQGGMGVIFTNLKETIKVFYFPCVLVAFWALYKEFGYLVSERPLVAIGVFYTLTIFISFVTNTSFQSYKGNGYCGWFYAANEISAITLILSPTVFYAFTSRKAHALLTASPWRKRVPMLALGAISIVLMLFASSYLATKAVFFGVVVYLLCYFIWNVFRLEITRDKFYRFRILAGLLMIVALAVL
ncbi:MAG: O-antigen ligase family protein, partial [Clostridia bacterium]|nr:O-antigen ligase family protein [Clostridia bacterium]